MASTGFKKIYKKFNTEDNGEKKGNFFPVKKDIIGVMVL